MKKRKSYSTVKRIVLAAAKYKKYAVLGIVCAFISVGLTLLGPVLTGNAIDCIVDKGQVDFHSIFNILIGFMLTTVGSAFFQWIMGLCTNKLSYCAARDLRQQVYSKFNSVPLSYIDGSSHGDLINRVINDVDAVGDGLLQSVTKLFTGVVTIVATLVFMFAINVTIALAVMLLTPVSLFVAAFIGKFSGSKFRKQQLLQGEVSSYIEEMVGNQQVVKSFAFEKRAEEEFEKRNQELYKVGQKAQFAGSLANPSTRFVNGLVYAAAGILGALSAVSGGLTVGQISVFLTYANQYTKPFNEITGVLTQLQTAIASGKRVFQVLDEPNETADKENAKVIERAQGNMEFENVNFSYRENQKLIENFNLKVKRGQRIAIVGPTGCGKTTMINLIMRFYDVKSGEIRLDGIPIKDIKRNSLRQNFAMVLQDSWLFNGTVRENLMYGNSHATEEDMIRAAKSAYAHGFISRLPKGYDTVITEEGSNLSQGEKQLLCIARAMLTNSPLLILDEATSSIDTLTEQRVQKAFAKMMEGKTSFVVAHRLSTIKEADVILVMKDGNIIEQGKHEELLRKGGFYSKLYNSQFS